MQPILNIAISAAQKAGSIILRHLEQMEQVNISTKAYGEYVTEVDIKADQSIIQTIQKAYPDHSILTEETGFIKGKQDITWIIDPIDGTKNFVHGFPCYGISIGVLVKGQIEHAVIYDPIRHELFSASRGRGAQLNERKIRVSKRTKLPEALVGIGYPPPKHVIQPEHTAAFNALTEQCSGIRRMGSAAIELAYVAAGRLDGVWKIRLRPWDIAAGALIVQEAGGIASDLQNKPLDYSQERITIVAGNPKIHKALLGTLV